MSATAGDDVRIVDEPGRQRYEASVGEVVAGRRRPKRAVAQMLSRTLIAAGIAEFRHLLGPALPRTGEKVAKARRATSHR